MDLERDYPEFRDKGHAEMSFFKDTDPHIAPRRADH